MPYAEALNFSAIATMLVVVALAIRYDVVEHRIPNAVTVLGFAAALTFSAFAKGPTGVATALAGGAVGFAALLPMWLLKGMGAGDVKLLAAVGSFLGPAGAIWCIAVTGLTGLAMALVVAATIWRRENGAAARRARFPYAIAIGVGALSALFIGDASGWLRLPGSFGGL